MSLLRSIEPSDQVRLDALDAAVQNAERRGSDDDQIAALRRDYIRFASALYREKAATR